MADIIGLGNNQIPLCGDLGQLAFQDHVKCDIGEITTLSSQQISTSQLNAFIVHGERLVVADNTDSSVETDVYGMYISDNNIGCYDLDDLYIQKYNGTGYDIRFRNYYSWSSNEYYAIFYGNSGVYLYYNGVNKFYTNSTGITVVGTVTADAVTLTDNEPINLGTGTDYTIKYDGSADKLLIDNQQDSAFCQINNQISTGIWEQVDANFLTSGTMNIDVDTASVLLAGGGVNLTGDLTINLRYNSSLAWSSGTTSAAHTYTVAVMLMNGGTAYKVANFQIDGVNQTVLWQGGTTPVGNPNSMDVYTFTVLKVGGFSRVLGSQSQYA